MPRLIIVAAVIVVVLVGGSILLASRARERPTHSIEQPVSLANLT